MAKTTTNAKFWTEQAPGTFGGPLPAILSTHRTWEAACKAARKSDRVVACSADGQRYAIPAQGSAHGDGRYGAGLRKGR